MSLNLLKQELRDFKSNLLEMSMEKNLHEDELIKLVDSTISKENITEILILIYSNSKSDLQSVKSYQVKTIIEVIDKLEAFITEYQHALKAMDNKISANIKDLYVKINNIDETMKYKLKDKFLNTWYGKVIFGIGTAIFIVFMFFYLYRLDPEGARFTSTIFNSIVDKTIDASKPTNSTENGDK